MAVITDSSTLEEIEDAVVEELLIACQDNEDMDEDLAHELVRPLLLHPEKFASLLASRHLNDDL